MDSLNPGQDEGITEDEYMNACYHGSYGSVVQTCEGWLDYNVDDQN